MHSLVDWNLQPGWLMLADWLVIDVIEQALELPSWNQSIMWINCPLWESSNEYMADIGIMLKNGTANKIN